MRKLSRKKSATITKPVTSRAWNSAQVSDSTVLISCCSEHRVWGQVNTSESIPRVENRCRLRDVLSSSLCAWCVGWDVVNPTSRPRAAVSDVLYFIIILGQGLRSAHRPSHARS